MYGQNQGKLELEYVMMVAGLLRAILLYSVDEQTNDNNASFV